MESNPVDALYRAKDGVDFQTADTSLKDSRREARDLPADRPARQGVELQRRHRRAGLSRRGHLGPALPGPLGEGAEAARHGRHRLPRAGRQARRFAANYRRGAGGKLELLDDPRKSRYLAPAQVNSGGGGLVSTAADYLRFCNSCSTRASSTASRLLGRKTVELMTMNHLKGDMADMGMPRFVDPLLRHRLRAGLLGHHRSGQGAHPGLARRVCLGRRRLDRVLVRPGEDMAVVLLTQLMPSSTYPIRRELRVLDLPGDRRLIPAEMEAHSATITPCPPRAGSASRSPPVRRRARQSRAKARASGDRRGFDASEISLRCSAMNFSLSRRSFAVFGEIALNPRDDRFQIKLGSARLVAHFPFPWRGLLDPDQLGFFAAAGIVIPRAASAHGFLVMLGGGRASTTLLRHVKTWMVGPSPPAVTAGISRRHVSILSAPR